MKLLRLEISNIASLAQVDGKPQVIDFLSEPLASAHLLAITGPTGAGKSSLLDALCLALYDRVPRLRQLGTSAGKVRDQGQARSLDHSANLLTRGQGRGHCVVDFVSHDGHRYRATWEVRRARDRASGALQPISRSLINLDTGVTLSTQKKLTDQLIAEKIGLSFEQFSRSVLLAQSDFSAFLKSSDAERAELLESLTDTRIYSALGRQAHLQHADARRVLDQLEQRLQGVTPLQDDERLALQAQVEQHQQALDRLQQALHQQQQRLALQVQYAQQQQQLDQHRLERQQLDLQAGEFTALAQTLGQLEKCRNLRHWLQQQARLQDQLLHSEAETTRLMQQLQQHSQQLEQVQQQQQQALQALQDLDLQHQEERPRLQQVRQLEQDRAQLLLLWKTKDQQLQQQNAQLQHTRQQQQALHDRLAPLQQQLHSLEQALQHSQSLSPLDDYPAHWLSQQLSQLLHCGAQAHGDPLALQQQIDQLQAQARDIDTRFPHDHADTLLALQQQQTEQLQALQAALQQQQQRQTLQQQLEQTDAQQQQTQQHLQLLQPQLTLLQDQLHLQEQQRQQEQARLDLQGWRDQLQPGHPCPLCGSREHPGFSGPAHGPVPTASLLEQTRAQLQALHTRRLELQLLLQHQQAQVQSLQGQLSELPDAWPAPVLNQQRQHLQQLQASLATLQQQQQDSQKQQQLRQQALLQSHQLSSRLQQLRQRQQQQNQLLPLLPPDWQALWPDLSVPLHAEALQDLLQHWTLTLTQRQQDRLQQQDLQQKITPLHLQVQPLQQQLDQQAQQAQQTQTALEQLTQRGQAIRQRWQASLPEGCTDSSHWESRQHQQRQQALQAERDASTRLAETTRLHSQCSAQLGTLQQRRHDWQQQLGQLQEHIQQWQQQHGPIPVTLLDWDEARIQQQQERLQQYREHGLRLDTQIDTLGQQQQRLLAQWPDLQHCPAAVLQQQQLDLQQALQQQQAQYTQLQVRLQQDDQLRQHQQQLVLQVQGARTELARWAVLNDLIGSAQGDKFRKLAQTHQLDLLLHYANQQLQQLFPRYQLQRLDDSLGIEVLDLYMGQERRSAYSLSGGETFLVSLALALGLASMASGVLRIESLFIDEGFGSLDSQTLHLAMDLLDRLQASGRRVMVISHVSELQERLPVQIRVQPTGHGHSRIQVVG